MSSRPFLVTRRSAKVANRRRKLPERNTVRNNTRITAIERSLNSVRSNSRLSLSNPTHNTSALPAVDLVLRSADGVLRKARNVCVGCLIETVRAASKTIDIDCVNRVLMQPHWQKETDILDY